MGGSGKAAAANGKTVEEEALRQKVREYESKLAEMTTIASRQASDISSLRTVAEKSLHEKAVAEARAAAVAEARAAAVAEATAAQASAATGNSMMVDEERWRRLMQEASTTQEQALANGQRQLHALAASLQAAQRVAAEQQAAEWRAALHEASEAHALVVRQLQAQLTATCDEKRALQKDLREARRASLVHREAAVAAQAAAQRAAAEAHGAEGDAEVHAALAEAMAQGEARFAAERVSLQAAQDELSAKLTAMVNATRARARTKALTPLEEEPRDHHRVRGLFLPYPRSARSVPAHCPLPSPAPSAHPPCPPDESPRGARGDARARVCPPHRGEREGGGLCS